MYEKYVNVRYEWAKPKTGTYFSVKKREKKCIFCPKRWYKSPRYQVKLVKYSFSLERTKYPSICTFWDNFVQNLQRENSKSAHQKFVPNVVIFDFTLVEIWSSFLLYEDFHFPFADFGQNCP